MIRSFVPLFLLGVSFLLAPGSAMAANITIDTVLVGNPGNPPDQLFIGNNPDNLQFGSVAYEYRIGKYEVTVGQYTAFLNAVAATDTYGLYNTNMATNPNGGITRSGSDGSYTYSTKPNMADKPVTFVSWGDAARFANWLHNGQPTGAQNASTTEDGAYTLNGATSTALSAVTRNAGARWFIPTEDEWYKAAYYDPTLNRGAGGYWLYPMRTNSEPYSDQPPGATPDNTRVGNFIKDDGLANGYDDGYAVTGMDVTSYSSTQNYLTDVGAYTSSPSPYGTYDQGGNVWEWNEALIVDWFRGWRGSSWSYGSNYLQASIRFGFSPAFETPNNGFRVASRAEIVPEPGTAVLGIVGCALMWVLRKRFK
jgi:formylglycine-generating enzyme required for sulfatase activity